MNILYQAFSIGSNVWLGEWSSNNITANDTDKRDLYLGVYGALGIGQGEFPRMFYLNCHPKLVEARFHSQG